MRGRPLFTATYYLLWTTCYGLRATDCELRITEKEKEVLSGYSLRLIDYFAKLLTTYCSQPSEGE